MANQSPKPCKHSACPALVYDGSGYCPKHAGDAKQTWFKKDNQSGRGGRPWRKLRLIILNRDGWLCQCDDCKDKLMPLPAHEVDHIVPVSQGGSNELDNLRAINRDCHKKKTQKESNFNRIY